MKDEDFAPARREIGEPDDETKPNEAYKATYPAFRKRATGTRYELAKNLTEDDFAPSREDKLAQQGYVVVNGRMLPRTNDTMNGPLGVADPLVLEVMKEEAEDTGVFSSAAVTRRDQRWQKDAAVMEKSAEAARQLATKDDLLDKLAGKLFKPVHVRGGPCQDAPEDETFVFENFTDQITCKACQAWLAILEGDATPVQEPDPLAKKMAVGRWRNALVARLEVINDMRFLESFCNEQQLLMPNDVVGVDGMRKYLIGLAESGKLDHGMPTHEELASNEASYTGYARVRR